MNAVPYVLLAAAFLVASWRVARGPRPEDRAVGGDLVTTATAAAAAWLAAHDASGTFTWIVLLAVSVAIVAPISFAWYLTEAPRGGEELR